MQNCRQRIESFGKKMQLAYDYGEYWVNEKCISKFYQMIHEIFQNVYESDQIPKIILNSVIEKALDYRAGDMFCKILLEDVQSVESREYVKRCIKRRLSIKLRYAPPELDESIKERMKELLESKQYCSI